MPGSENGVVPLGEAREDGAMRRLLKVLALFLVVIAIMAGAVVFLIPRDHVVALAVAKVRDATGRDLVLSGEVAPSFWPVLGLRTGPVRFSNAPWAEVPDMVTAGAAEIGVELLPLLTGHVNVTTLRLVDPVVALEIGADGRANWDFGGEDPGGGGGGRSAPSISLPEAVIANGTVRFSDARSGRRLELAALDLTAGLAGLDAPMSLDGSGIWNGKQAKLVAVVDSPSAMIAGDRISLELTLASEPVTLAFEGEIQQADDGALSAVSGNMSASMASLPGAVAWATGSAAPQELAELGAASFEGSLAATDALLAVSARGSAGYRGRDVAFEVKADGAAGWRSALAFTVAGAARSEGLFALNFTGPVRLGTARAAEGPLRLSIENLGELAGWVTGRPAGLPAGMPDSLLLETRIAVKGTERIGLGAMMLRGIGTVSRGDAALYLGGARPLLNARLESGPLDLSAFAGQTGGPDGAGGNGGWSTAPLDLSALRAVDADVQIRAEAVDLGEIELGRSEIDARLQDGRLDLTIRRLDAYGGGVDGTIALMAGREVEVAADLGVANVQLRPLLAALSGTERLEGLGNFRIRATGRGGSMDALMRSLSGAGSLDLADGAILGINLAAIVRNLTGQSGGSERTDFSAVSGTFDIRDGVLHNSDFSFLGPLLRIRGAGTVDIGGRGQNLRLEPTAVSSLAGQGGSLGEAGLGIFPILVTGTWANPSIRPDLAGAVQALLLNPDGTVEAFKGLIGGDAGQAAGALLGTIAGGGSTGGGETTPGGGRGGSLGGSLGGALGGILGGALGGGDGKKDGRKDNKTGAGGEATQLGALGSAQGGAAGAPADEENARPGSEIVAEPGQAAPVNAPLPRPSDAFRQASASPATGGTGESLQPVPADGEPAVPGPVRQEEPSREPSQEPSREPAAAEPPAPAQPAAEQTATVSPADAGAPAAAPAATAGDAEADGAGSASGEPPADAPATEPAAATGQADEDGKKKRKKKKDKDNGGLDLKSILQGIQQ